MAHREIFMTRGTGCRLNISWYFGVFHLEHCTSPGNPMSLFEFYIMVDWSGATRRRGMRADTIWTAYGGIEAENPKTDSPFSRVCGAAKNP
jgi:hypothetical protein